MKALKILLLILLMVETASAQIVLEPTVAGTCEVILHLWYNVHYPSYYNSQRDRNVHISEVYDGRDWSASMSVSTIIWHLFTWHGVFEFDLQSTIGGAPFPPEWMTSQGWQAYLDVDVSGSYGDEDVGVDLHEMINSSQDGVLTSRDFKPGSFIARLSPNRPSTGTSFCADVTAALRDDLFGSTPWPTSGFILKPTGSEPPPLKSSSVDWSLDARIRINFLTETPTPEPSPTPENPCDTLRVRIRMPSTHFSPGDPCSCHLVVCNPGPEIYTDIPLIVALDVFGTYFFWPDFTSYDNSIPATVLTTVPPGPTIIEVLPTFVWPEGAGTAADGVQWIAGMTNPDMTTILGDYGTWEFGWGL